MGEYTDFLRSQMTKGGKKKGKGTGQREPTRTATTTPTRPRKERHCPHCKTVLWAVRQSGYRGGWAWFPRGFAGDALCAHCARGLADDQTAEGAR